jgi:hemoglobin-like flavoprotein
MSDKKDSSINDAEMLEKTKYNLSAHEHEVLRRQMATSVKLAGGMLNLGVGIRKKLATELDKVGLTYLFQMPPKVLAFMFMRSIDSMLTVVEKPDDLAEQLYNLGMRHINYVDVEILAPLTGLFAGCINSTMAGLLEEEFLDEATWVKFWAFVAAHIITTLRKYAKMVQSLRETWSEVAKLQTEDGAGGFGDGFYFNVGLMSTTVFQLFRLPRDDFARGFNSGVLMLVEASSNPVVTKEEWFILSARHQTYGVKDEHFAVMGQAFLVTLRALLPRMWNKDHEEAWTWFFKTGSDSLVKGLSDAFTYKPMIRECAAKVVEMDIVELGLRFYVHLFTINPAASAFFTKPKWMISAIFGGVLRLLSMVYEDGGEATRLIRATGIRHIKYGIPPEHLPSVGPALCCTFAEFLEGYWNDDQARAWTTVFEFCANCMTRAIYDGTTLVTRALMINSVDEVEHALEEAPRGERSLWVLEIDVCGIKVSPFNWGIQDGKFQVCCFMLDELTTTRADREKYYSGKDDLFRVHRNIMEICAKSDISLLLVLCDGLVWESMKVEDGRKRVNYFLRDIYGDPENYANAYSVPMVDTIKFADEVIFAHPLVTYLLTLQWRLFGQRMFVQYQALWFTATILFFFGFTVVDRVFDTATGNIQFRDDAGFILRAIATAWCYGLFFFMQMPRVMREVRMGQVSEVKIQPFRRIEWLSVTAKIPMFFQQATHVSRVIMTWLIGTTLACDQWFDHWMDTQHGGTATHKMQLQGEHVRAWTAGLASIICLLQNLDLLEGSLETLKLRQRCGFVVGDFLVFIGTAFFFCFCFAICMWTCKPHLGFGNGYMDYEFMDVWRCMVSCLSTLFGIFIFRHTAFSAQQLLLFLTFCILATFILSRQVLGMFVDTSLTTYKKMGQYAYMRRAFTLIEYNAARTSEERFRRMGIFQLRPAGGVRPWGFGHQRWPSG